MDNKSKTANPGILIMALLLVLLALVVVLIAVVLATDTKDANEIPKDSTTTQDSLLLSSTPVTTTNKNPDITTTSNLPIVTTVPGTDSATTTTQAITTAPVPPDVPSGLDKSIVSISSSESNKGALLFVDKDNLITYRDKFPARSELIGNKTLQKEMGLVNVKLSNNYKMPHTNHFLNADAAEYFYDMMADFVKQTGSKDIFLRNAYYCDYSEAVPHANIHATGYAVDLQIMNDNGQFSLLSNAELYNWLVENCWKYGYIFCGDTKGSNTSSGYSTFRFIGTAHSDCMQTYSMDLEQYLSYISGDRTPNNYLQTTDEYGVKWWIYYVAASEGETTDVVVYGDEDCYEISGDNLGGFIVTINAGLSQ